MEDRSSVSLVSMCLVYIFSLSIFLQYEGVLLRGARVCVERDHEMDKT